MKISTNNIFVLEKQSEDLVTFTEEILNEKLHFCEIGHRETYKNAPINSTISLDFTPK